MKVFLARCVLIVLAHIGIAHASVISFEGATSYGSAVMPNLYSGLVWRGFGVINQNAYAGTDYSERSSSGDFYAFNLGGDRRVSISTDNGEFVRLNSAQFSSFVDDALTLSISGRSETGDWYSKLIQVGRGMELISFGWVVDKLEIYSISSLGASIWGDPTKFFMDDLAINESPTTSVPEPSILLLVLAAMLAVWPVTWRNHNRTKRKAVAL